LYYNKKACSQPRKQAIILQAALEEHRLFGNPAILSRTDESAERTRGFVSPGSPEFTLSETLHFYIQRTIVQRYYFKHSIIFEIIKYFLVSCQAKVILSESIEYKVGMQATLRWSRGVSLLPQYLAFLTTWNVIIIDKNNTPFGEFLKG
jgi:hypothetical protein